MTTAKNLMELQIYRRRCDPSNDIETPLLIESTRNTVASDENVQGSADEEKATPFPRWLMLANIIVAPFGSTAIAMGVLQSSENQVIGPLFVDVILIIGFFAMMLGVYFLIKNIDVKTARAFLVVLFTVGIILGMGMETLALTTVADSTREQRINVYVFVVCINMFFWYGCYSLAAVLGDKWDEKTTRLCWFTLVWMVGIFMGVVILALCSVLGRQGGGAAGAALTLLSFVLLTFFGAGIAAYFLAVVDLEEQEEEDGEEESSSAYRGCSFHHHSRKS
jgi:hypothetical protein